MEQKYGYVDTRALCDPVHNGDTFPTCPRREQFVYEVCYGNTEWCNKVLRTKMDVAECFLDYCPESQKFVECIDYGVVLDWIKESNEMFYTSNKNKMDELLKYHDTLFDETTKHDRGHSYKCQTKTKKGKACRNKFVVTMPDYWRMCLKCAKKEAQWVQDYYGDPTNYFYDPKFIEYFQTRVITRQRRW